MPDIEGLSHIDLTVRDLDASTRWYMELLGLRKLSEEQHPDRTVRTLGHRKTRLIIGLNAHNENPGEAFSERRTGLDHIGFLVSGRAELEVWEARFDELGVEHSPITDASYGSVLVFRDPDNIQLEMFARPGT